jgi:hypothetical protein
MPLAVTYCPLQGILFADGNMWQAAPGPGTDAADAKLNLTTFLALFVLFLGMLVCMVRRKSAFGLGG